MKHGLWFQRLPATGGIAGIAALLGLGLSLALAQAQTVTPSFEVVFIKQSKPETRPGMKLEHGRLTANLTLSGYIDFAYDLMPSSRERSDSMLAHAPKWVSTDNFEISALAEGDPTKDQMRLMVRSLLADRFRLEVHTVTALLPVLAFTLEKPGATGPKLRPHSEGSPCDVNLSAQDPRINTVGAFPPVCGEMMAIDKPHGAILVACRNTTIERIAAFVSSVGRFDHPVVDQTGLSGRFDFTLEFTPEPKNSSPPDLRVPPDYQATTLAQTLQEQLGLKLKSTKAPLDTLVVDHAERPTEN